MLAKQHPLWYTFSHLHTVTKVSVHFYLSWRKQPIHLYIHPDTPARSTLRSNPSLYTLSKALDRSYNTATVFSLFLEGILYFLCE